jgi:hypothetical protein
MRKKSHQSKATAPKSLRVTEVDRIESISDLERLVSDWEEAFFDMQRGHSTVWYRGQGVALPPQPGILRPPFLTSCDQAEIITNSKAHTLWAREVTANQQFRRMGASLLPAPGSDVLTYFLAQHHGMPTRLLDWTLNSLAALFFAVAATPDADGVLYHFNAQYLGDLQDMRSPVVADTVKAVFGDSKIRHAAKIIPIIPDLFAGRMLQQNSVFTLHTPPVELSENEIGFEFTPQTIPGVKKCIVPKEAKSKLRLALRRLGLTEATLFPDLDHVAKELRAAWNI